jgi:hypothetical protein
MSQRLVKEGQMMVICAIFSSILFLLFRSFFLTLPWELSLHANGHLLTCHIEKHAHL